MTSDAKHQSQASKSINFFFILLSGWHFWVRIASSRRRRVLDEVWMKYQFPVLIHRQLSGLGSNCTAILRPPLQWCTDAQCSNCSWRCITQLLWSICTAPVHLFSMACGGAQFPLAEFSVAHCWRFQKKSWVKLSWVWHSFVAGEVVKSWVN